MYKRLLIATDGSVLAQGAASTGVGLAKAIRAEITAFFAAPLATPTVFRNHLPVGYAEPGEHRRRVEQAIEKHLGFIEALAANAGVACTAIHTTSDRPDEAILHAAAEHACDLLVMGAHGQSGLRGVLLGSVAQKVVNSANIPVLIVGGRTPPEWRNLAARFRPDDIRSRRTASCPTIRGACSAALRCTGTWY
jgi:nucleotide-binding universal stress UspA family protein